MSLYKGNGFVLADKAVSFFAAVFVLRPDNIFAPFLFFERGIFFPKNAHSVSMEKKFRLLKKCSLTEESGEAGFPAPLFLLLSILTKGGNHGQITVLRKEYQPTASH